MVVVVVQPGRVRVGRPAEALLCAHTRFTGGAVAAADPWAAFCGVCGSRGPCPVLACLHRFAAGKPAPVPPAFPRRQPRT